MTINEILKHNGDFADFEIYRAHDAGNFHTDNLIECIDPDRLNFDYDISFSDISFQLMNEEEYNNSVMCNTCVTADFDCLYRDSDARVLVITIKSGAYIAEYF